MLTIIAFYLSSCCSYSVADRSGHWMFSQCPGPRRTPHGQLGNVNEAKHLPTRPGGDAPAAFRPVWVMRCAPPSRANGRNPGRICAGLALPTG
jgi:hypothetical protein